MFPSKLFQELSKTENTSSSQNAADTANTVKPPELTFQDIGTSIQRTRCINLFMRTRMILRSLTSNINPNEPFSTPIALNRIELIFDVFKLYQKLHSMISGEDQETNSMVAGKDDLRTMFANDLELQKLMNDTTDMVNIVKEVMRKHINVIEISTEEANRMDTSYTSDSDGHDSDGHKHKKMKFSD